MFESIKKAFGLEKPDLTGLIKEGAIILDVRSAREYVSGHIEGSINVPVGELEKNLQRFKDKNKTIITCCASGMRSASAKNFLTSNGYTNVHNGGGWQSLNQLIK